ncbi:zinc dependent phospholipase C family protein [Hymenobacter sp. BT770]|uniref:zinc dependent phospholipase C family protein n=1 Tax=Hymenobacter sp. BT770 TaxID=2886942 RepID=UPI001D12D482|nr:zinc dependent phospholipase C family protein [Hymenobacter sp. BT770]MCC3153756.1 zinc dependent phospholipase C family protein [Hymenobacter sp. BT770]MDO3416890.1 zinc dependent phospholipase C family protein [Hymenobacter sp. BT770]
MKKPALLLLVCLPLLFFYHRAQAWGFFGHRLLNRLAVYTLPPAMVGFYKANIDYLTTNATRPDSRRMVVPTEAPKHFLDVDRYGDSAAYKMPRRYADAVARYGEDSLLLHGIVPWNVVTMKNQLTAAFQARDTDRILHLSADLGHYIADACVPLHTTKNYNGQLTNQRGIHGLWESRLPELLSTDYDLFSGKAQYLEKPTDAIWAAVIRSHAAVDSVFRFEKELTAQFPEDRKYGYEQRGTQTVRTYSREFSKAYHARLNGQVERQMRYAAALIGNFWYTCWVDAGSPDLSKLPRTPSETEKLRLEREAKEAAAAPVVSVPGHDE